MYAVKYRVRHGTSSAIHCTSSSVNINILALRLADTISEIDRPNPRVRKLLEPYRKSEHNVSLGFTINGIHVFTWSPNPNPGEGYMYALPTNMTDGASFNRWGETRPGARGEMVYNVAHT